MWWYYILFYRKVRCLFAMELQLWSSRWFSSLFRLFGSFSNSIFSSTIIGWVVDGISFGTQIVVRFWWNNVSVFLLPTQNGKRSDLYDEQLKRKWWQNELLLLSEDGNKMQFNVCSKTGNLGCRLLPCKAALRCGGRNSVQLKNSLQHRPVFVKWA